RHPALEERAAERVEVVPDATQVDAGRAQDRVLRPAVEVTIRAFDGLRPALGDVAEADEAVELLAGEVVEHRLEPDAVPVDVRDDRESHRGSFKRPSKGQAKR